MKSFSEPPKVPMEDSAINELLEGRMDLFVTLNGRKNMITIDRCTPMMDLLIQIATMYHLNASDYRISLDNGLDSDSKNIRHRSDTKTFKASTPIGSLDVNSITLVPKAAKQAPVSHFEATFRLQVKLPHNQFTVHRVKPSTTISCLRKLICDEKELKEQNYRLVIDDRSLTVLDLNKTIGEYGVNKVTLMLVKDLKNAMEYGLGGKVIFPTLKKTTKRQAPLPPVANTEPFTPVSPYIQSTEHIQKTIITEKSMSKHVRSNSGSDSSGYHESNLSSDSPEAISKQQSSPECSKALINKAEKISPCKISTKNASMENLHVTDKENMTKQIRVQKKTKRRAPPPPKEECLSDISVPLSSWSWAAGHSQSTPSPDSGTRDMDGEWNASSMDGVGLETANVRNQSFVNGSSSKVKNEIDIESSLAEKKSLNELDKTLDVITVQSDIATKAPIAHLKVENHDVNKSENANEIINLNEDLNNLNKSIESNVKSEEHLEENRTNINTSIEKSDLNLDLQDGLKEHPISAFNASNKDDLKSTNVKPNHDISISESISYDLEQICHSDVSNTKLIETKLNHSDASRPENELGLKKTIEDTKIKDQNLIEDETNINKNMPNLNIKNLCKESKLIVLENNEFNEQVFSSPDLVEESNETDSVKSENFKNSILNPDGKCRSFEECEMLRDEEIKEIKSEKLNIEMKTLEIFNNKNNEELVIKQNLENNKESDKINEFSKVSLVTIKKDEDQVCRQNSNRRENLEITEKYNYIKLFNNNSDYSRIQKSTDVSFDSFDSSEIRPRVKLTNFRIGSYEKSQIDIYEECHSLPEKREPTKPVIVTACLKQADKKDIEDFCESKLESLPSKFSIPVEKVHTKLSTLNNKYLVQECNIDYISKTNVNGINNSIKINRVKNDSKKTNANNSYIGNNNYHIKNDYFNKQMKHFDNEAIGQIISHSIGKISAEQMSDVKGLKDEGMRTVSQIEINGDTAKVSIKSSDNELTSPLLVTTYIKSDESMPYIPVPPPPPPPPPPLHPPSFFSTNYKLEASNGKIHNKVPNVKYNPNMYKDVHDALFHEIRKCGGKKSLKKVVTRNSWQLTVDNRK